MIEVDTNILLIGASVLMITLIAGVAILKKGSSQKQMKLTLIDVTKQSDDTMRFTFKLPNSKDKLGLKIGQHLQIEARINGESIKRYYTPISKIDEQGTVKLLIKVYEQGKMSQYLSKLQMRDQINIKIPFGRLNYEGKKLFKITKLDKTIIKKKFDYIYMVAGGTGITPFYQIIQYISDYQKQQRPQIILLFANKTEDDILLRKQLQNYEKENYKFRCYFSVDKPKRPQQWKGYTDFIDEQKFSKTMPKKTSTTLFLCCGPPAMCNVAEKIWSSMKIPYDQIYRF